MPRPDLTWKNHIIMTLTMPYNILQHIWKVSELHLKVKAEAKLEKHNPTLAALPVYLYAPQVWSKPSL